ncbi:MAG: 30S ribosome-binding factor RbfA [Thermodesulfobacteriota bacterium]|nr:30S ribosome-binding factor RbfA [Thermodesulfobacteriota bacterium]
MDFKRADRVSDLLKEEIAQMLLREIKDPRIGFVTITDVKVSDDLRLAKVFFSMVGGDKELAQTNKGLNSASSYIKKKLGKRLKMRYIPDIQFKFDSSFEYGSYIDSILKGLKEPMNDH